jgi:cbb3-type cytochrome c oxidase subunit III
MLNTKLGLALGILFLGFVPSENLGYKNNWLATKSSTLASKKEKLTVVNQNLQSAGKEIYTDFCIQCHGADGKGDGVKFPPLAGSDWLIKKRKESIHAVKFGQNGEIKVNKIKFNSNMPTMGLSNQEVADVMNYVMNSWGNKQKVKVTEKEVAAILY